MTVTIRIDVEGELTSKNKVQFEVTEASKQIPAGYLIAAIGYQNKVMQDAFVEMTTHIHKGGDLTQDEWLELAEKITLVDLMSHESYLNTPDLTHEQ